MVNFTCNSTASNELINETPLWNGGPILHHVGLIISAVFGLIATILSMYLMYMHATHYLKPWEQKHIIRILFMVPVYSIASFCSYLWYMHYIYWSVLQQCYEAFVIASFFTLVCAFIAPDLHSQKDYFRQVKPMPWVWPLNWCVNWCGGPVTGRLRTPRSGLTAFNIIFFCVFQYCFIRVFMTLVAVITQLAGRYCIDSLSPIFAHIWVTVIEGISVSVAMYCIIQFYLQIRADVVEHGVFLKVIAIKLVIFLSFWQTLLLDLLSSAGAIKSSQQIADPDIKVGIPTMLLCIEMAIFAVLHMFAYPWSPYDIHRSAIVASETNPSFQADPQSAYQGGRFGHKAFLEAANPWDMIKAVGRGFKWVFVGRKHRELDPSYKSTAYESTALDQNLGGSSVRKPGQYYPLSDEDDSHANAAERLGQGQPGRNNNGPSPYYGGDMGGEQHSQQPSTHTAYGMKEDEYDDPPSTRPYRQDSGFQSAPVGGAAGSSSYYQPPPTMQMPQDVHHQGVGGEVEMPSPTGWGQQQQQQQHQQEQPPHY